MLECSFHYTFIIFFGPQDLSPFTLCVQFFVASIRLCGKNEFSNYEKGFQSVLTVGINSGKTVAINVESNLMSVLYVMVSLGREIEIAI